MERVITEIVSVDAGVYAGHLGPANIDGSVYRVP